MEWFPSNSGRIPRTSGLAKLGPCCGVQALVFVLWNLEYEISKNEQKLPVFLNKNKTKA